MSRRLSLLGPPVLTAQTAHFPPPLASATASATVSTVRPVAAAASASSDTALGLPTVDRHYLQLCYRRIFASSHSLPFSLCSPLPPAHDWEQTWKSRPLRRPPPPSHQSGHPPRPPCAIRKAHFALPCGCRLALLSPLAFPSHSRTRSTSLLQPPERTIPREQNKQPVLCDRRTGLAPVPPCLPSEPDEAIGLLQSTARFTTSLPFFYHGDRRPSTLCAPRRGTLADLDQPQEQAKL